MKEIVALGNDMPRRLHAQDQDVGASDLNKEKAGNHFPTSTSILGRCSGERELAPALFGC